MPPTKSLRLKKLRPESIPRAVSKAERYRLLNEPRAAESICRDILAIEPDHQDAVRILILALTDQFPRMKIKADEPSALLERLDSEYARAYYQGVIHERWAKALLGAKYPHGRVYECFADAMASYEQAINLSASDDQDAVLRWNTCVRIIDRYDLKPPDPNAGHAIESFDDEVPFR